jgi:hypothetical protein
VRVKAMVTERVGPGVAFMPFHFGGWFMGEDRRRHYPPGTDPTSSARASMPVTTYGYDPVTFMQETKVRSSRSGSLSDGTPHLPLRQRPLHRVQRLRHRLQERA